MPVAAILNNCSAVVEMGNRLGVGAAVPLFSGELVPM